VERVLADDLTNRTVLIVEDEWLIRADLAAGLEEAGWAVLEASTGEGAVEQLRNGKRIDLLVTDIHLAGHLSGWDVAEAARKVESGLPVLYVSANPANPSRQVEGSMFLSKPCLGSKVAETGSELVQSFGRSAKGNHTS
jgi:DNA-binding response OmpR family regulator